MSETLRPRIEQPHADIEHQSARAPFDYLVTFPDRGLTPETGLIFVINGFGMTPEGAYNTILRRYLASRYNCLAVEVFHFGLRLKASGYGEILPAPGFFESLHAQFGVSISAPEGASPTLLVQRVCRALHERGVTRVPESCLVLRRCGTEYESFGLLPALDHLQVLGALLARYPLDRRRLYALGTSMGGYIALFLAKLAPNSFRMVVDCSGFTQAPDLADPQARFSRGRIEGVVVRAMEPSPWEAEPGSSHGFHEHNRRIRDLTWVEHMVPTRTLRCLYHSVADDIVPLADKERYAQAAAGFGPLALHRIGQEQLDGVMFKTLAHGMNASLRHLFDHAWSVLADRPEAGEGTDFCRESALEFPCGHRVYRLRFAAAGTVELSLGSLRQGSKARTAPVAR
jgi:pimeloyl-ACP methyl ester carboxylesterase